MVRVNAEGKKKADSGNMVVLENNLCRICLLMYSKQVKKKANLKPGESLLDPLTWTNVVMSTNLEWFVKTHP